MNTSSPIQKEDIHALAEAFVVSSQITGFPWDHKTALMAIMDLVQGGYSKDDILYALTLCRHELTRKLTLHDVLERIWRLDGRPDPDEAWGMCAHLLERGDDASMVISHEMAEAMSPAQPLFRSQPSAARAAFLSLYTRRINENRLQQKPVTWFLSAGTDRQQRIHALMNAAKDHHFPVDWPQLKDEYNLGENERGEVFLLDHQPVPSLVNQSIKSLTLGKS